MANKWPKSSSEYNTTISNILILSDLYLLTQTTAIRATTLKYIWPETHFYIAVALQQYSQSAVK